MTCILDSILTSDTSKLRYGFTSMKTPSSVFEFDMVSKNKKLLKQQEIIDDNFEVNNYKEKRFLLGVEMG